MVWFYNLCITLLSCGPRGTIYLKVSGGTLTQECGSSVLTPGMGACSVHLKIALSFWGNASVHDSVDILESSQAMMRKQM